MDDLMSEFSHSGLVTVPSRNDMGFNDAKHISQTLTAQVLTESPAEEFENAHGSGRTLAWPDGVPRMEQPPLTAYSSLSENIVALSPISNTISLPLNDSTGEVVKLASIDATPTYIHRFTEQLSPSAIAVRALEQVVPTHDKANECAPNCVIDSEDQPSEQDDDYANEGAWSSAERSSVTDKSPQIKELINYDPHNHDHKTFDGHIRLLHQHDVERDSIIMVS